VVREATMRQVMALAMCLLWLMLMRESISDRLAVGAGRARNRLGRLFGSSPTVDGVDPGC